MEVHTLTVKATPSGDSQSADAAETKDKVYQILATQDIEITPGSGGSGTIKGNTADSEEISLSGAVFESAENCAVEVATKTVDGVPTITVGVYYA